MAKSEKQQIHQPVEGTCAGAFRNGVYESRSDVLSKTLHPTIWHLALLPFVLTITLYLCTPEVASAQGVSISDAVTPPDASAGLDVNFSDKGFLIPRMTTAQRDAINGGTFANALFIFNTDDNCFQIYNGVQLQWENVYCFVGCSGPPAAPGAITGNTAVCENATSISYSIAQVAGATSYNWTVPAGATITAGQGTTGIVVSWATTAGNMSVTASNNCGTATAQTLAITLTPAPTIAAAGTDQAVCAAVATLAGNTPTTGTGLWTLIAGAGTITTSTSPTSGLTGLGIGANTFRWTITNAPCAASTDDVIITRSGVPTTANAGTDINPACGVTTATLAGNTPTVGTGNWSVVSGTATITTPTSPTSGVTGLVAAGTATLRWTISNAPCTPSIDDVVITTSACAYVCGQDGTFVDARDGKTYGYVDIGAQRWMCENLAYLPSVVGPASNSNTVAYHYVYGYSGTSVATAKATANYTTYGVLYNWTAAMNGAASSSSSPSGVQGACPAGWHLPSDAEWCTLENTVEAGTDVGCNLFGWRGTNTGGDLKETGTTNWNAPNTGATNTSGFTALPGGFREPGSNLFVGVDNYSYWWPATENSGISARSRNLLNTEARMHRDGVGKANGYSLRCIKD